MVCIYNFLGRDTFFVIKKVLLDNFIHPGFIFFIYINHNIKQALRQLTSIFNMTKSIELEMP